MEKAGSRVAAGVGDGVGEEIGVDVGSDVGSFDEQLRQPTQFAYRPHT